MVCVGGGASGYTRAGYVNGEDTYFISPDFVCGRGGSQWIGGNFTGNGAGTLSNVTINVASGVSTGSLYLQSSNYNHTTDPNQSFTYVNGVRRYPSGGGGNTQTNYTRGHTVAVIDPASNGLLSINTYDTYGYGSDILTTALNKLPKIGRAHV